MIQYPQTDSAARSSADDFSPHATQPSLGLTAEFLLFLKWWLLPVVVLLLIVGVLIIGGMALAPIVYALF